MMKSSKPQRPSLSAKGRSSRSGEGHGTSPSPTTASVMDAITESSMSESSKRPSETAPSPSPSQAGSHIQAAKFTASPPPKGLEIMRKRMSEALSKKQEQRTISNTPPSASARAAPIKLDSGSLATSSSSIGDEYQVATSGTLSTDSARTIKAAFDMTPGTVRTPSYPFPRMNMRLQRGYSQRSGPHHKPFTLLSPTNEMPQAGDMSISQTPTQLTSSELSTPIGHDPSSQNVIDDPSYPTPDLYDMVLMLSTEPGLEAWWANATEILAEAYGAERASLALPGDVTDLENVPWGQKATFNIYASDSGDSTAFESHPPSEIDLRSVERSLDSSAAIADTAYTARRPPLLARHSIAGAMPETISRATLQRPTGPVRATSTIADPLRGGNERVNLSTGPRLTRQSPTPRLEHSMRETSFDMEQRPQESFASISSGQRCYVHRSLQPLEAEDDALLVRTGVAELFGKRKPVILTRAYSEDSAVPGNYRSSSTSHDDILSQSTFRSSGPTPARSREGSVATMRAFNEYEQPEPSPWSQSPSPSPAARPDPAESPFFTQSVSIDEDAFRSNPPAYDYGATANQSLNAIGTDFSRTLIHIPLIQPVPSRNILASGLRFPVAILSFLSPVNPYPRSLRRSLSTLLPHLASTFALAQQFSNLQQRLRGGPLRRGAGFGLGGTFSDEGSELELVTELSTQLQPESGRSKGSSTAGSVYSFSERTAPSKGSPPASVAGTPHLEHLGLTSDFPGTPGRVGSDMVDSYFLAKRQRQGASFNQKQVQQQATSSGPRIDESPERQRKIEKTQQPPRGPVRKVTPGTTSKTATDTQAKHDPHSSSVTSDSFVSDQPHIAGLDRIDTTPRHPNHRDSLRGDENEKPLPELLSSLMLNAVPLQLFLAKPTTGDLVWTNRKFDAFRSQGEGRVRDPWKNVHVADRPALLRSWDEALKTGSQFTHYMRVKRFNSDSDFRWFVFRASTLLSNSGRLLYWIGSFLDVHEQYIKNVEASEKEASMARDAKIRALADAIPQVLFESLEGEGIVSVNQQWHSYSGQTLDEARGLGFARQVHREDLQKCGVLAPVDLARVKSDSGSSTNTSASSKTAVPTQSSNALQKSLFAPDANSLDFMIKAGSMTTEEDENGRTSYTTEIRLRSKGGEFRWFLIRLVKVQNDLLNNGRASWYGTCTDIETRMGLEKDLNEANRKVHSEMESKTKFFANMSHEIRTPLNGILGSMPWLVESQLDHDQRRTVDTIQNSANNLRELVDNILDVTKVEAGKMTLLPKWFHVRSLCEEVVDTVSSRAIERGLELNYSLDAEVPAMVRGDPFRVRQVLLNLMGNAVKFTEQGEVFLRCTVRPLLESGHMGTRDASVGLLNFDVADTGRGFNETEFKRLFKQFGQIEGASQHDAGSGLGLFLSKQLVEMHGGELSVTSKTGEGSTFSFFVRVEMAPPSGSTTSPDPTERPGQHRYGGSFSTNRSRSDIKTPTFTSSKSMIHTPGLSKYASPEMQSPSTMSPSLISPAIQPSEGSGISFRSNPSNVGVASPSSSLIPTPESVYSNARPSGSSFTSTDRHDLVERAGFAAPFFRRSKSDNDGSGLAPELAHPQTYSIVVICPAEYARTAIKQHIEHVVPHQIAVNVTILKDVGAFLDLVHGPGSPTFTHIVIDLPASSDIMLFMRQMSNFTATVIPALVVVTDHYQKRDILEDFSVLTSSGRKAYLVHKPVKPSVFAMIFDPAQLRNLSKDRAREVAQTSSDDFKKITNQVKATIGNKAFRLLLVEDSDVNRMVIQRYLKRVGLDNDEARDGQECVDKVFNRPHGYYSLIICDIQMPKKNGYQTCTEIRQWEAEHGYTAIPIMALTANAMPEEKAAAGSAGFTDYLTKPVDFNRLGVMMVELLDAKRPHVFLRDQPAED